MIPDECAKAFETILYQSGKFGSYQRRLYLITSCMHVVCASILTFLKFIPEQTRHQTCVRFVNHDFNNSFIFLAENETATYPMDCRVYYENDLNLDDKDWNFPEWTVPDYGWSVRQFLYYSQRVGLLLGLIVGSFLSDYCGRRRMMYASYSFMCVCHTCAAITDRWEAVVVCEGFVGISAGCFIPTSLVLVLEYLGHDWRDICICLMPWWLGPSLLALEAYLTRDWRLLLLVSGGLGLPFIGSYFLVMESCRWLVCNHKFSEAEQTTKELVSCNCRAVESLTSLFDLSRACVLNTMHKKRYTFADLLRTNAMRKWTFAVIFTWFIGCMVYCGLHRRVTNITSNPYFNLFLVYSPDVIVIFSAIFINRCLGRRWCIFLYAMSSGFIAMCILVLHVTNESDIDASMVTALAFFTKLGVTASITLVSLVTMEMYPTVVRSMGFAVGCTAGLIGFQLAEHLIQYLATFHYTVPFLVYGGMMVTLAIGSLLLPETLKHPLPDILRCRHRNLCSHEAMQLASGWAT